MALVLTVLGLNILSMTRKNATLSKVGCTLLIMLNVVMSCVMVMHDLKHNDTQYKGLIRDTDAH